MHAKIPGSQFVLIPTAGHLSNIEPPEAFNRAVLVLRTAIAAPVWRGGTCCFDRRYRSYNCIQISAELYQTSYNVMRGARLPHTVARLLFRAGGAARKDRRHACGRRVDTEGNLLYNAYPH